jgi:hypothetical protein
MSEVAKALKDHAYRMVAVKLRDEIDYQYDSVWGDYYNHVAAAMQTAADSQQATFKEAERKEEESEKLLGRALFAFNIVTALTLSWLSAALQYRTDTIFAKEIGWRAKVRDGFGPDGYWVKSRLGITSGGKDQVGAKLFGDSAKLVADLGIQFGMKKVIPPPTRLPANDQAAANSPNLETFKTRIKDELSKQKNGILAQVDKWSNAIENDVDSGRALLNNLLTDQPALKKANSKIQEQQGQRMINEVLNRVRERWADSAYYFGNDPPEIRDGVLADNMERTMWEAWLAANRKLIYSLGMEDKMREKSWFTVVMEEMASVRVLGAMKVATADSGNEKDDAIDELMARV